MKREEQKTCQNCERKFTIFPKDFAYYEKIKVPAPTFCPECRAIRRMNFRNARVVYKRKVEGAEKEVFSAFSPELPLTIFDRSLWLEKGGDPVPRGEGYDFSRPFFEQLKEVMQQTPWPSGWKMNCVNSDYCNNVTDLKNCYLMFNSGFSENSAYGTEAQHCHDAFDCTKVNESQLVYELLDCDKCNRTFFSQDCVGCTDVYFSNNLLNCHDCFGCINLRHKQYCVFNKQFTEEEYKDFLKKTNLGSYEALEEIKKKVIEHYLKFPRRYMHGQNNENVKGDYLDRSKNVQESYLSKDLEDCGYCQLILFLPARDCYDIAVAGGELCYELEEGGGYGVKFAWWAAPKNIKSRSYGLSDMEYSMNCYNSSYLFGCVGLQDKQYCILNRQYTKKEYVDLVPKIIKHMSEMPYKDKRGREYKYGEFFPAELSPFAYNETIAQEYFPLTKEEALERGYSWRDVEKKSYQVTTAYKDLPDSITEVQDSILKETISCAHGSECSHGCTGAFRLLPSELEFYRKFNLPLPRACPNCRHYERIAKRNPLHLWKRKCNCGGKHSKGETYINEGKHFHGDNTCPNEMETSYSPDRDEIVYCGECFSKEIA